MQNYCTVFLLRLLICHFLFTITNIQSPNSGCQYFAGGNVFYFVYFNKQKRKQVYFNSFPY